ncbi:MAG TPA: hypothetical protein VKT80_04865 [Chloroflexota bacterium]|nr:hypothetical protein [Chloroflexota bacterium]
MIWVPHLHAFVHTRLHLGVDGDIVEEDLANAIASGDIVDDDQTIAAFCADYFDLSASIFPVKLDVRGLWQRVEE